MNWYVSCSHGVTYVMGWSAEYLGSLYICQSLCLISFYVFSSLLAAWRCCDRPAIKQYPLVWIGHHDWDCCRKWSSRFLFVPPPGCYCSRCETMKWEKELGYYWNFVIVVAALELIINNSPVQNVCVFCTSVTALISNLQTHSTYKLFNCTLKSSLCHQTGLQGQDHNHTLSVIVLFSLR